MIPLKSQTLFVTLAGSQAHGTSREGSDVDLRGVCVAPPAVRLSLFESFEQCEGPLDAELAAEILPRLRAHPTAARALGVKTESVIYDVAKFVGLCAAGNPNTLEILFADERDWVYETLAWRQLYDERHLFLTKKVQQTFLGYAMAQLRRIETHRSWLLHPPVKKPSREDFGLPSGKVFSRDDQDRIEQAIAEQVRSYGIDTLELPKAARVAVQGRLETFWRDALAVLPEELESRMRAVASHALCLPPEVTSTLNAEKKYRAATKRWESYQSWKANRNPARAALEQRHGYDTKHAMHLVRMMRMGLEVLEHGELWVRRADAKELSDIRDGALRYDDLLAQATELRARMEAAAQRSALPEDVDRPRIDALALGLMTG